MRRMSHAQVTATLATCAAIDECGSLGKGWVRGVKQNFLRKMMGAGVGRSFRSREECEEVSEMMGDGVYS